MPSFNTIASQPRGGNKESTVTTAKLTRSVSPASLTPLDASLQMSQHRAGQHQDRHHRNLPRINSKHVPRYLAEFEYRFNRRYDLAAMIPRLTWAAVRTTPMPYRLLKLADVCA